MKQLLKETKYRITIKGLSSKLPPDFMYMVSVDEDTALRRLVHRIVQEVQRPGSPYSKTWKFKDGTFECLLAPKYGPLFLAYLQDNPHLVKVEKLL